MNYEHKDNREQDVTHYNIQYTILMMFNGVPEHRMHVGI